ncbi:hypothetical protein EVG20_g5895 [Dentipellis fragilis]|uniref:Uncharacterized protein n=1 Tax=Dentipellis fragilis TaxID=205917 RepID=A0A4Y9YSA3_9AGAM|nr:hypothetical protein EVG20_g5895 [Dentipellis fragilis]
MSRPSISSRPPVSSLHAGSAGPVGYLPEPDAAIERAWGAMSNDNLFPVEQYIGPHIAVPFPNIRAIDPGSPNSSTASSPGASSKSSEASVADSGYGGAVVASCVDSAIAYTSPKDGAEFILDTMGRPVKGAVEELARAFVNRGSLSTEKAIAVARMCDAVEKAMDERWLPEMRKAFSGGVRVTVLKLIREHWAPGGANRMVAHCLRHDTYRSCRAQGLILMQFLGSLFCRKVAAGDDVFIVLGMLIQAPPSVDRIEAMHALIQHCNDRLCRKRHADWMWTFRTDVSKVEGNMYAWGSGGSTVHLVQDILKIIDKWYAIQIAKNMTEKNDSYLGHHEILESRRRQLAWYKHNDVLPKLFYRLPEADKKKVGSMMRRTTRLVHAVWMKEIAIVFDIECGEECSMDRLGPTATHARRGKGYKIPASMRSITSLRCPSQRRGMTAPARRCLGILITMRIVLTEEACCGEEQWSDEREAWPGRIEAGTAISFIR